MNLIAKKRHEISRNHLVACGVLLMIPLLMPVMYSVSGGTKLAFTMCDVYIHTCMSISICQELPKIPHHY